MIENIFEVVADTYIEEGYSGAHGDEPGMTAGVNRDGTVKFRSLVGFSVNWQSAPIVKAELRAYYFAYETGLGLKDPVGRVIQANALLKHFDEVWANWIKTKYGGEPDCYWDGEGADAAGIDYDAENPAYASVPPASASGLDRWMKWDVSNQMRVLQQRQQANVEFRVKMKLETAGYMPIWYQREGIGGARLIIQYGDCVPGATKCVGVDLYTCDASGVWKLTQRDSPQCGGGCTPGETKCVGADLYTCNSARQWELTEENSPQCEGGVCTPGQTKCAGAALYTCNGAGQWELTEENSPQCEGGICTPGETQCVGVDLYTCNGAGQWELTGVNSAECGGGDGDGGSAPPWKWIGLGIGAIIALLIARTKKSKGKAPEKSKAPEKGKSK